MNTESMALSVKKVFPPDAGLPLMLWHGHWERFESLCNNKIPSFSLSHPFSSNFSGNLLAVSVNCRNLLIRSTITMNLWMLRFKFSLCLDYFSKNCYNFNHRRCFLNVSIHKDYNTWNSASFWIHGKKALCQLLFYSELWKRGGENGKP